MNKPQSSLIFRCFLVLTFLGIASVQVGYAQDCVAIAGPNQVVSQVNAVFMDANAAPVDGLGTWSRLSGPPSVTIADVNDPQTQLLDLVPGDYIFEWTVSKKKLPLAKGKSKDLNSCPLYTSPIVHPMRY